MTPQTVNAVNLPLQNAMNFPAAILEAPFFDPNADDAANYGAIGAVIGHEISHGFDNLGAEFDAAGPPAQLVDAGGRRPLQGRGRAAGQAVRRLRGAAGPAHQRPSRRWARTSPTCPACRRPTLAYHKSLDGKPAPVIDGLSGDQRFFLAFAQAWRSKARDAALRSQVVGDEHAPGQWRALTVRNIDAWYDTFKVKPRARSCT